MKYTVKLVLLLILPFFGWAQHTVVHITPEKFSENIDAFNIDAIDGWVFHKGNDSLWARKAIDTKGWEKLKPTDLSEKYADKNGRVEGWFRIKVTLDSSLLKKVLYVDFGQWASTAFYVDGELLAVRGNTGEKGKGFREYNGGLDPLSIRFDTPAAHILSLHYVGYLSPVPPYDVKTQSMKKVIRLGGPNYTTRLSNNYKTVYTFRTSWWVVCATLSLLFWLLIFQNPKEKNLFWIALYTSALAIYTYYSSIDPSGTSFNEFQTNLIVTSLSLISLIVLLLPILLIKVFKRKLNGRLILTLIILIVVLEIGTFFPVSYTLSLQYVFGVTFLFVLGICLYYVITSWKNLRGAQWAIVGGLIFTVSIYLTSLILYLIIPNVWRSQYFNLFYSSVVNLAFPFSLLIYVSMRFKEMIQEVQLNAQKVVELSEEKKEQAVTQQKILEEEVVRQTGEIRQTLANLKSTQSQLIQSEKMASLGELTSGIAHEIQNPLNFVNNFSEVSMELLEEVRSEKLKAKSERSEELENELLDDITQNLQKISHHGKRADSIVKGMLQHSRTSTGEKQATNINTLADEFLKLSYHGLRAKDKSFNSELITNFDENLPKINVVQQDIGRVLLNLFNNAFYAVKQRTKTASADYKPIVEVSTLAKDDFVVITVKDNGTGIPEGIKEKIMQPFFTTKPTGEGTGLGLSLSYDIVKAHGGSLTIDPDDKQHTAFIIKLPTVS